MLQSALPDAFHLTAQVQHDVLVACHTAQSHPGSTHDSAGRGGAGPKKSLM